MNVNMRSNTLVCNTRSLCIPKNYLHYERYDSIRSHRLVLVNVLAGDGNLEIRVTSHYHAKNAYFYVA